MRHVITTEEIIEWLREEEWRMAASSYSDGNRSNKRLEVSTSRMWRVTDHGDVRYSGPSLDVAVAVYNAAP